ncbi:MAG: hypothetical protein VX777_10830 [Chlamydiota bacterium]|nr:hypothetical protein [Chlamydiota bacterium]
MTSFPQLLMNRELGLPGAQQRIVQAMELMTARNLASDSYYSETINLPQSSCHKIFRCRDLMAVLSMNKTGQKVYSLALWSLITRCKLWDIELDSNYIDSDPGECLLNEYGMVLINSKSMKGKIIVLDGKLRGVLPKLNWYSIVPIGNRILGCWAEGHNPNDGKPCWRPENSNHFFGEWDEKGKSLNRYLLDHTRGRSTHQYACNKGFWVRLSGSQEANLTSIIEVVDRVTGTMKTFELPLIPDQEQFSSACIVQNRLFYGKNAIRPWGEYNIKAAYEPTICIYDLVKGVILEEFPTGAEKGEPKYLVASQSYAAWLEYRGSNIDRVKYLNVLDKTVKDATVVPYCVDNFKVVLNIAGAILSVTYAEGYCNTGWAVWRRKVIDMSTGELKCDVGYKRYSWRECSNSNGTMLITDCFRNQSRIYMESFANGGLSGNESSFRGKLT